MWDISFIVSDSSNDYYDKTEPPMPTSDSNEEPVVRTDETKTAAPTTTVPTTTTASTTTSKPFKTTCYPWTPGRKRSEPLSREVVNIFKRNC